MPAHSEQEYTDSSEEIDIVVYHCDGSWIAIEGYEFHVYAGQSDEVFDYLIEAQSFLWREHARHGDDLAENVKAHEQRRFAAKKTAQ